MTRMPTFLIVGAAKSGTTALYAYLQGHPQVFLSTPKEPMFFDCEGKDLPDDYCFSPVCTRLEDYQTLFAAAPPACQALGEASTVYLYSPEAPARIRRHLPEALLVALLRNPVDRAFSHYCYFRQHGREPMKTFSAALAAEPERMRQGLYSGWFYRDRGFYAAQLERYFHCFPREQMRVFLHEDFLADRAGLVREVLRFIGVDDSRLPNLAAPRNVTALPRSRFLDAKMHRPGAALDLARRLLPPRPRTLVRRLLERFNTRRPKLRGTLRAELTAVYRDDILRLQQLLGRDLSAWLKA